jgi:hypothetical protein
MLGFRTNCEPLEGYSLVRMPFSDGGIPSGTVRHQMAMPRLVQTLLAPSGPGIGNAVWEEKNKKNEKRTRQ